MSEQGLTLEREILEATAAHIAEQNPGIPADEIRAWVMEYADEASVRSIIRARIVEAHEPDFEKEVQREIDRGLTDPAAIARAVLKRIPLRPDWIEEIIAGAVADLIAELVRRKPGLRAD